MSAHKVVPFEPTPKMLDVAVSHALMVCISSDYNWSAYMREVWQRMYAAAPNAFEHYNVLDAYDFTDRTAHMTDCASEWK